MYFKILNYIVNTSQFTGQLCIDQSASQIILYLQISEFVIKVIRVSYLKKETQLTWRAILAKLVSLEVSLTHHSWRLQFKKS